MTSQSFGENIPLDIETIARRERDRYLAQLIRSAARALWQRAFGTAETTRTVAEPPTRSYVRESGLARMPDAHLLATQQSNDETTSDRDDRAA